MCALLENTVEAGLFLMIILHVLSISWVPFHAQSGSLYVSKNTGMLSVQKAGLDMLTPSIGCQWGFGWYCPGPPGPGRRFFCFAMLHLPSFALV